MNKRKFGIVGEKIAQDYLRNKGYEIIKNNFFTKKGEIDIIAMKNEYIIFVEVKTRTSLKYGRPAIAVNTTKKKHLKKAAEIFLHINRCNKCNVRFDIVEVYINKGKCYINQIEGIM